METIDEKVREILEKLPSECGWIDYKVIPYKETEKHEILKDVISMLNSEEGIGKDKFIIMGVEDSQKYLKGIEITSWKDDNEWQIIFDKIAPRPIINTGFVEYYGKKFGYFFIPASNNNWVYEASETVVGNPGIYVSEKNIITKGQAFSRRGSSKRVLLESERIHLRSLRTNNATFPQYISATTLEQDNVLTVTALLGAWDETSQGDVGFIQRLAVVDGSFCPETFGVCCP